MQVIPTLDNTYDSWCHLRPGDLFKNKSTVFVSWPPDGYAIKDMLGFPVLTFTTLLSHDMCLAISVDDRRIKYDNIDTYYHRLDVVLLVNTRLLWTRLESHIFDEFNIC